MPLKFENIFLSVKTYSIVLTDQEKYDYFKDHDLLQIDSLCQSIRYRLSLEFKQFDISGCYNKGIFEFELRIPNENIGILRLPKNSFVIKMIQEILKSF